MTSFQFIDIHIFIINDNLLQSLHQSFSLLLKSRLSKKSKHVLLVALYTRLVKWIYSKDITADTAGKLKEVEELSEIELILLRNLYHQVWYISIGMSKDGSVHGTLVDKIHGPCLQDNSVRQDQRLPSGSSDQMQASLTP